MNREHTQFHLNEAMHELESVTAKITSNLDYSEAELYSALEHIYHHLNTAWNARDESNAAVVECSESDFNRRRKFPSVFDLHKDE
jgi:hypothetical protein